MIGECDLEIERPADLSKAHRRHCKITSWSDNRFGGSVRDEDRGDRYGIASEDQYAKRQHNFCEHPGRDSHSAAQVEFGIRAGKGSMLQSCTGVCRQRMPAVHESLTPRRTGMLIKSGTLGTVIGSGEIEYLAPYARQQYHKHKTKQNGSSA